MNAPTLKIVKGVTITPPTIGRIMIGHVELRRSQDGTIKAIPAKDDHFTVTTLVQQQDRVWEPHPIMGSLSKGGENITAIPVRLAYNDPGLSLHNRYSAFAPDRRIICSGDGESARRMTESGVQTTDCPGNEQCQYGREKRCKNMSRLYIQVEEQENPLGVFVLRTTSRNSLDSLAGTLSRLAGYTSCTLAGMPMMLTLTPMTTAQSMWTAFYVVGLELRAGMSLADALTEAKSYQESLAKAGLSQEGMETAMRTGLANSDFADVVEDPDEWVSDDDLAGRAEQNLLRHGLRGLDSLRARQQESDAESGESAGIPQAESPESPVSIVNTGIAAVPPDDEEDMGVVEVTETPVATLAAVAAAPVKVIEAVPAPVVSPVAKMPDVSFVFVPPKRPVLAALPMPPMPRARVLQKGRTLPGMPRPHGAVLPSLAS